MIDGNYTSSFRFANGSEIDTNFEVLNKNDMLSDLLNISDTITAQPDEWITGFFIFESIQMIKFAINTYEMGYFDAAYYYLRSSIELCTTMIYLADLPYSERKEKIHIWKSGYKKFPMRKQMILELNKNGKYYRDMIMKMEEYFKKVDDLNGQLNKYVHKQGLLQFHTIRRQLGPDKIKQKKFNSDFCHHLKECIGIIAVMRLAIDPFPILLADKEIHFRVGDTLIEPYSDSFLYEYIGDDTIRKYKETLLYTENYYKIIEMRKMLPEVARVMQDQCFDLNKLDAIMTQVYLLSHDSKLALHIFKCNAKIRNMYFCHSLTYYTTSENCIHSLLIMSSELLNSFEKFDSSFNQPYKNIYISTFQSRNDSILLEHEEKLQPEEIIIIASVIQLVENQYDEKC